MYACDLPQCPRMMPAIPSSPYNPFNLDCVSFVTEKYRPRQRIRTLSTDGQTKGKPSSGEDKRSHNVVPVGAETALVVVLDLGSGDRKVLINHSERGTGAWG
jgi:hypothetical protein